MGGTLLIDPMQTGKHWFNPVFSLRSKTCNHGIVSDVENAETFKSALIILNEATRNNDITNWLHKQSKVYNKGVEIIYFTGTDADQEQAEV